MINRVRSLLFKHPALERTARVNVPVVSPELQAFLPTNRNIYEISPELGAALADLVVRGGRRRVLEFGAGASSRVHAAALAHAGGGMLTSVELDPEWCAKVWLEVEQLAGAGVDTRMVAAPVRFMVAGWGVGYAQPAALGEVSRRAPYDLVLIDAPGGNYGRLGTFPLVAEFLEPGATVVVDDAKGSSSNWIIASWLRRYPGLELEAYDPEYGRRGLAILRWHGGPPRWSARAWLGGCYHAVSRWRRRRGIG
jgi:predicted O-methyltransferase YrrM